jgi:uncharacterized protein YbjT (DUF2867 family)
MKIVVIGGTGLIGSKLVRILKGLGHEAIAASPTTGVNTVTKEGLETVLKNTQIVVDVSDSPSMDDGSVLEFFISSNKNLLAAEKKAGVHQHIALSVIGSQNLGQSGYFKSKIAQEELIKSSNVPYTIVYSTQFFEFIETIIQSVRIKNKVLLPKALVQPIASDEVAAFMTEAILQSQVNETIEIAGPEIYSMEQWANNFLVEFPDNIVVLTDNNALFLGAKLTTEILLPSGKAKLGEITFTDWQKHKII